LQDAKRRFEARGIKLAAISYDNTEILKEFGGRFHIEYPLLSDPHSEIIRSFGLVDPDNGPNNLPEYAKKDMALPGFIYVDKQGVVHEKFFGVRYFDRYTANNALGKLFPELLEASGPPIETAQFKVIVRQSDREAIPGSRVTVMLDVILPKGMHIYAPEVKGYKPVKLVIDSLEEFRVKDSKYPQPRIKLLPAIKESVPVYVGRFRIAQDLMVVPSRQLMESLNTLGKGREFGKVFNIHGHLQYQACDKTTCYPPAEIPLSWQLRVHQYDDVRASEKIQDRPNQ
jgi:hypothetical protein